jgi:hypothetical protein
MAASYPTAAKSFTTKSAGDTIQPAHINDIQDEVTAVETALVTGGLAHALKVTAGAGAASLTLPATGRLYLDGGGNTYIDESAADNVRVVAGGNANLTINSTTITVNGQDVSFGANDSGGTGYRLLRVPNV